MYKLIIIDDEKFTLEHLSKSVQWSKYGFELSATFSNPLLALEYIKLNTVDAVISDIRMNELSGLEIAKILHENYPNILCVLLSAYKEFDYAREAIKYGVVNYLLKPISFTEIEIAMNDLREKLDANIRSKTIIKELSYFKIQKNINAYLENETDDYNEFTENLSALGIPHSVFARPLCEAHIKLEDFKEYLNSTWTHGMDNFYSALNRISNYEGIYFLPIKYNFDEIDVIILFSSVSEMALPNTIERYIEYFTTQAFEILNIIVSFYSYKVYADFDEFKDDYNLPDNAYKLSLKFITMVLSGNDSDTVYFVNELVEKSEFSVLKEFSSNVLSEMSKNLKISERDLLPKGVENVSSLTTITKIKEFLSGVIHFTSRPNESVSNSMQVSPLQAAKQYINEHYAENVTLTDVANYVAFSPSHFSRYFKKETGENFIYYLNKVRVEKAKGLLVNTRFKIHEICKMVGYIAPMYFYKVFKQHTGYTAQEYRNLHSKTEK